VRNVLKSTSEDEERTDKCDEYTACQSREQIDEEYVGRDTDGTGDERPNGEKREYRLFAVKAGIRPPDRKKRKKVPEIVTVVNRRRERSAKVKEQCKRNHRFGENSRAPRGRPPRFPHSRSAATRKSPEKRRR